ncbi:MAG: hypothetical protein AAF587_43480 [Bacteroidota bacterium]
MCEVSKKLIFCSCLEKKDGTDLVGEHTWTLNRYIGSKESLLMGKLLPPSNELDSEITVEKIIREMNSRNCFDFDYKPQERDCFQIDNGQGSQPYQYFSLIYRDGRWEQGRNPAFGRTISENIAKGRVKRIDK